MKHLPSYILLLLAANACNLDNLERTYDLTPKDNVPVLVMNALMDGGEESHSIELFNSYAQTTEMATASNLAVEVNGSPIHAGASQKGGEVIYSAFHSGDRLSIRATAGSRTALRLAAGASCAMDGGSFTFFFFPSFSRAKPMVSSQENGVQIVGIRSHQAGA